MKLAGRMEGSEREKGNRRGNIVKAENEENGEKEKCGVPIEKIIKGS
jgi:hypothetical protein